jgi:hypothetical protein
MGELGCWRRGLSLTKYLANRFGFVIRKVRSDSDKVDDKIENRLRTLVTGTEYLSVTLWPEILIELLWKSHSHNKLRTWYSALSTRHSPLSSPHERRVVAKLQAISYGS